MKRLTFAMLTAVAVAFGGSAVAQDKYPSKPVKIIVPYAPGGATDITARLFGEQLKNLLGQQFVVESKPGAFGIIATTDVRGLRRYYAAGTVARFAMASLAAPPRTERSLGGLESVRATLDDVPEIAAIEAAVFGYPRHADYPWLFAQREAYLYRRAGRAAGFGFFSETGQGPIAALEPADLPAILLHLEARAHALGMESISFEVPSINQVAMQHLLGRGFKVDAPLNLLMSNVPFGQFDRLIAFGPAIVL